MGEPCGWTVESCGCSGSGGKCWDSHSPATRAQATALAVHLMWAATGRRYGLCEVTVMPCNPRPAAPTYQTYPVGYDVWGDGDSGGGWMRPVLAGGVWRNECSAGCCCASRCGVGLPGPVDSILAVNVAGVAVDLSAVQVHDRHLMVRTDGLCWPSCQTFGSEIPGFETTYLRGDPIPAAVQYGLEILACEYAKACTGGECRLPQRLARLSRQGVDVTVAEVDSLGRTKGGLLTDIKAVDDVIAADNPHGRSEVGEIVSPDYPPPARTVTWVGGS